MTRSDSTAQLAHALAKAQAKFKAVAKDKRTDYQTRSQVRMSYGFADLAAHIAAVRPALAKNGIALMTPARPELTGATPHAVATVRLEHESGEWMESDPFTVPIVDPMDARSIGSACTYARKYALQGFLGISPEEEDDDGEAARGGDFEQARTPAPRREAQPSSPAQPKERAPARAATPAPAPARATAPRPSDDPQPTVAEQARSFARAARDKQIFDDALATGIEREKFHAWAETILGRPYSTNADWTDSDREILEDECRARRDLAGNPIPGQAVKAGAP